MPYAERERKKTATARVCFSSGRSKMRLCEGHAGLQRPEDPPRGWRRKKRRGRTHHLPLGFRLCMDQPPFGSSGEDAGRGAGSGQAGGEGPRGFLLLLAAALTPESGERNTQLWRTAVARGLGHFLLASCHSLSRDIVLCGQGRLHHPAPLRDTGHERSQAGHGAHYLPGCLAVKPFSLE